MFPGYNNDFNLNIHHMIVVATDEESITLFQNMYACLEFACYKRARYVIQKPKWVSARTKEKVPGS